MSRWLITASVDKGCTSLRGSRSDKIPDAVSQLKQGLRVLPPSDVVECVASVPPLVLSGVSIKGGPFAFAAQ